jgi:predicted O-methyltransferase YrrM
MESETRNAVLREEHMAESLARLPGPHYYHVLKSIHRILKPANYLEIGVSRGFSLAQARPGTRCVGVDPEPRVDFELPSPAAIYELASDEFFAEHDLHAIFGGPIELAFIDGLHLFEHVLRDFVNVEVHSTADTVVVLHDCLPLDSVTAERERTTDFFSGDVWKAVLALRRRRPDLEMVIVPAPPTGLCLVRSLDGSSCQLERELPELAAAYRDLDFDYYLAHRHEMPRGIPNSEDAVKAWLIRDRRTRGNDDGH